MAYTTLCDLMAPIFPASIPVTSLFPASPWTTHMESHGSNKFALSVLRVLSHPCTCHFFSSILFSHTILKLSLIPLIWHFPYLCPTNFLMHIILYNLLLYSSQYVIIELNLCLSNIVSLAQINCLITCWWVSEQMDRSVMDDGCMVA